MAVLRVLLVEDEPISRLMNADVLHDEGSDVVEAWDGDEAARFLDYLAPFDMLIIDVLVPGSRDGIAVAVHARNLQSGIPVLVVSGHALDTTQHLAVLAPAVAFLKKGYKTDEVVRVSRQLTLTP